VTEREEVAAASRADARRLRLEALRRHDDEAVVRALERSTVELEKRARELARPLAAPSTERLLGLVTVRIASERCGVDAAQVREVVALSDFAPLPGAQPPLFGVTAWRGELLLLLDIRRPLGLSSTALNDLRHVVVLGGNGTPVGMLVDEVLGMTTLRADDVRPMRGAEGVAHEIVRGVTSDALVVLETTALMRVLE
jgi:purine-binding chemotaxis protein CheW